MNILSVFFKKYTWSIPASIGMVHLKLSKREFLCFLTFKQSIFP
jgi:hypothetical protein